MRPLALNTRALAPIAKQPAEAFFAPASTMTKRNPLSVMSALTCHPVLIAALASGDGLGGDNRGHCSSATSCCFGEGSRVVGTSLMEPTRSVEKAGVPAYNGGVTDESAAVSTAVLSGALSTSAVRSASAAVMVRIITAETAKGVQSAAFCGAQAGNEVGVGRVTMAHHRLG